MYLTQQFSAYNSRIYPCCNSITPPCPPGAGHGRVMSGKGGIRPSYQASDSIAVELPSYPDQSEEHKDTQKRLGFTW